MKPLISVLMLSYNHDDYIRFALESVVLNKSELFDLEIIVIDDGSDDDTVKILNEFKKSSSVPVTLIEKSHKGVTSISANFNELISMANGTYLSFLASDDYFEENRFAAQLHSMQANQNVVLCYANGVNFRSGKRLGNVHPPEIRQLLGMKDPLRVYNHITSNVPELYIQTILVRAQFIKSMMAFDEELIADDWVFNINVFKEIHLRNLEFDYVDENVFVRNFHDGNTSNNIRVHFERRIQVVERYCDSNKRLTEMIVFGSAVHSALQLDFLAIPIYFERIERSVRLPLDFVVWAANRIMSKLSNVINIRSKASSTS
jgi:glycosyltransferase involved in cell wall biosynthesis